MYAKNGHPAEREEPRWVSPDIVRVLHDDVIRADGGLHGVRDEGLLDSALNRARQRWTYDDTSDLAACAAAYCIGLAKNHAFADGNKRTAFQIMFLFLGLNGLRLVADEKEVVAIMLDVATGKVTEEQLAVWIRARTKSR